MRLVLIILMLSVCSFADAQLVKNFFKWSTVYASGNISQPLQESTREWFVTQNGDIQDITEVYPFNYTISVGIRKMARFDYERKPGVFYDGTEENVTWKANIGAVDGFEYNFSRDWQRQWGETFRNQNYFIRYLGKYGVGHIKYSEDGVADLEYLQVDIRGRKSMGKKFNITLGGVVRTHGPYGFNPIEQYLDNHNWWDLAYENGYADQPYTIIDFTDNPPDTTMDWTWKNSAGEKISDTDGEFRRYYFGDLVNEFNDSILKGIGTMMTVSAAIGVDFYHHNDKFWCHAWVNVLPFHKHISGDEHFSYGEFISRDPEGNGSNQWVDYNVGLILGAKIGKRFGLFVESDYLRYWDKTLYSAKGGINYFFK